MSDTPIINIFTFGLPFKLANQIYKEFQERVKEANFLIENSNRFKFLRDYNETLEILIALSIFHKRVISNLDGAVKFYGKVSSISKADIISMGSYDLTLEEKNKILALLINYRTLIKKFGISEHDFDYTETNEFLLNIKRIKSLDNYDDKKNKEFGENIEDDIPGQELA